jgi:uncharacterized repeat protein (TIGR04042 family)
MPEMHFRVRWPDRMIDDCYSPSLVIKDHLTVGESYALSDFLQRCRIALTIASERVREKYGVPCSRALNQLAQIESAARHFATEPDNRVTILSFDD